VTVLPSLPLCSFIDLHDLQTRCTILCLVHLLPLSQALAAPHPTNSGMQCLFRATQPPHHPPTPTSFLFIDFLSLMYSVSMLYTSHSVSAHAQFVNPRKCTSTNPDISFIVACSVLACITLFYWSSLCSFCITRANLSFPNPMHFLRHISKADDYDIKSRTMGKYLLEVGTLQCRLLATPPSLVAAAAT
jgi:hypothetical protein